MPEGAFTCESFTRNGYTWHRERYLPDWSRYLDMLGSYLFDWHRLVDDARD